MHLKKTPDAVQCTLTTSEIKTLCRAYEILDRYGYHYRHSDMGRSCEDACCFLKSLIDHEGNNEAEASKEDA